MKLHDYIVTIPALTPENCQNLIKTFEDNPTNHIRRENKRQHFTELNLGEHYPELNAVLSRRIRPIVNDYTDIHCPQAPCFPWAYGLEQFRIKRYNTGECFNQHVDTGDLESSKRFLAFLFYLNDDFEGGGTLFRTPEAKYIKPKTGDVLVFPPSWQYPHEGMKVTNGTKYIMSSYLHYVSPPPGVRDLIDPNNQ